MATQADHTIGELRPLGKSVVIQVEGGPDDVINGKLVVHEAADTLFEVLCTMDSCESPLAPRSWVANNERLWTTSESA
jgi:hypothetical protein